MAKKILIYNKDGSSQSLRCESAQVKKTLNKDDYISFKVITETHTPLSTGAYLIVDSVRYTLNNSPVGQKISSTHFQYDYIFEAPIYDFKRSIFKVNGLTDTSYIGTASDFVDRLVSSLAADGFSFSKGTIDTTDALNLTISGENCWAMLNRICTDFDLEYYISGTDFTGYSINLTYRVENDRTTELSLSQGDGNGIRSIAQTQSGDLKLVTRLYYEGASKNLPAGYGYKRLQGSTSYVSSNESQYGVFADVHYFDDIYPTYTGTITNIRYEDDTPIIEVWANIINWNDYFIQNIQPTVNILDGDCAGYSVGIKRYQHSDTEFYLIPQQDTFGNFIPSSSGLNVSIGNTFKITECDMPTELVTTAIAELDDAAAVKILEKNETPREFPITLDAKIINDFYSGGGSLLKIGDKLNITDTDLDIPTNQRITAISYDLFYKPNAKITISDSRFAIIGREEEINNYISEKSVKLNQSYEPNKVSKTVRTPEDIWNQTFKMEDGLLDVDKNARKESFDPVHLALDSGEPQYTMKSAKVTATDTTIDYTGGNFIHRNYNALSRFEIDKLIEGGGTYAPAQSWSISSGAISKSAGTFNYVYAKVDNTKDISGNLTGTTATIEASTEVLNNKYTTDDYLYYLIGTVDENNDVSMLWGNGAGTGHDAVTLFSDDISVLSLNVSTQVLTFDSSDLVRSGDNVSRLVNDVGYLVSSDVQGGSATPTLDNVLTAGNTSSLGASFGDSIKLLRTKKIQFTDAVGGLRAAIRSTQGVNTGDDSIDFNSLVFETAASVEAGRIDYNQFWLFGYTDNQTGAKIQVNGGIYTNTSLTANTGSFSSTVTLAAATLGTHAPQWQQITSLAAYGITSTQVTNWDIAYVHSQLTSGNPHSVAWLELTGGRSTITLSGFNDDLNYLSPNDNVSELVNDSGYLTSADLGGQLGKVGLYSYTTSQVLDYYYVDSDYYLVSGQIGDISTIKPKTATSSQLGIAKFDSDYFNVSGGNVTNAIWLKDTYGINYTGGSVGLGSDSKSTHLLSVDGETAGKSGVLITTNSTQALSVLQHGQASTHTATIFNDYTGTSLVSAVLYVGSNDFDSELIRATVSETQHTPFVVYGDGRTQGAAAVNDNEYVIKSQVTGSGSLIPTLQQVTYSGSTTTAVISTAGYQINGTSLNSTHLTDTADLVRDGDNVSRLVNDAGYLVSSDLSGYVTIGTDQNITGLKTIANTDFINSTNGSDRFIAKINTGSIGSEYSAGFKIYENLAPIYDIKYTRDGGATISHNILGSRNWKLQRDGVDLLHVQLNNDFYFQSNNILTGGNIEGSNGTFISNVTLAAATLGTHAPQWQQITSLAAYGITSTQVTNWDIAYGWGDWNTGVNQTYIETNLTGDITTHTHSQYLTSTDLSGYATQSWVSSNFDNYDSWDLEVNGIYQLSVASGAAINFSSGTGIAVSWDSGSSTVYIENTGTSTGTNLGGAVSSLQQTITSSTGTGHTLYNASASAAGIITAQEWLNYNAAYSHSQLTSGNPHGVSWSALSGAQSNINLSGFNDDLNYTNYWSLDSPSGIYYSSGVGIGVSFASSTYDLVVGSGGIDTSGIIITSSAVNAGSYVRGAYFQVGSTTFLDSGNNAFFTSVDSDGNILSGGVVRADGGFNVNGTGGATGTIDLTTVTSINVSGGIITGWS